MAKDEKGKELSTKDLVKLRFLCDGRCTGVIQAIEPDTTKGGRAGKSKRSGHMLVSAQFVVSIDDLDAPVEGVIKLPNKSGDYGVVAKVVRDAMPRGVVRIPMEMKRRA